MATVSATSIVFSPRGVPGKDEGEEGWRVGGREREGGKKERRVGGRKTRHEQGREEGQRCTMKGAKEVFCDTTLRSVRGSYRESTPPPPTLTHQ